MGFNELISVIDKNRRLFIQMHRQIDPDCLASAVVLQGMLTGAGLPSQIVYSGLVSKPEHLEFINNLDLKLIRIDVDANKGLVKPGDQIIVVDCQKENGNVTHLAGEYIACIDHHPELQERTYLYKDIRPEFGACSSMMYEYAAGCGYKLTPEQAALMIYGIRVDTQDLSKKKFLYDIDIFASIYKLADLDLLLNIGKNSIRPEDISTTITAYGNLTIKNNVAYSFAGDDKPKELLSELAEKLISLSEVNFVVVYSKCFNGYNFSVRSQVVSLHAGKIVRHAVSLVNGDGGGHAGMSGGLIPKVAFMDLLGDKAVMERVIGLFEDAFENVKPETGTAPV